MWEGDKRAAEEGRDLCFMTPASPHWLTSPLRPWTRRNEIERNVSEGHTEVVLLRRNVHVYTVVLPVTQHLRSCSPVYDYTRIRWETSDLKVPHLTHSNLATQRKHWPLLFPEVFQPACTKPSVTPRAQSPPHGHPLSCSFFKRSSPPLLKCYLQQ